MYFFSFIILYFCAVGDAAVIPDKEGVILNYEYKNFGNGNYAFSYVTSNGIIRNETGVLVTEDQGIPYTAVHGYYGYRDPNGLSRLFQYTADKNGYHVRPMEPIYVLPSQDDDLTNRVLSGAVAPQVASLLGK